MPCYKPLSAYHGPGGIKFKKADSFGIPVELPCGRCIGCRLEKAKEWALRCHHEASLHEDNSFVTLTYDNEHLPEHNSLCKLDFQKFIRSLRKRTGKKIRYFMCGEYGEATEQNGWIARPHYHALLFGFDFIDKYTVQYRNGNPVYRSDFLEKVWNKGASELGAVTFQSAGYVARYTLKKQNGEYAEREYAIPDENGEITNDTKVYPYTACSLKPGIGYDWYKKFKADLFPHDYAIMPDGRETSVPTYYRTLLQREDPEVYEQLRKQRVEKARTNPDNEPERLAVREAVRHSKIKRLKRDKI